MYAVFKKTKQFIPVWPPCDFVTHNLFQSHLWNGHSISKLNALKCHKSLNGFSTDYISNHFLGEQNLRNWPVKFNSQLILDSLYFLTHFCSLAGWRRQWSCPNPGCPRTKRPTSAGSATRHYRNGVVLCVNIHHVTRATAAPSCQWQLILGYNCRWKLWTGFMCQNHVESHEPMLFSTMRVTCALAWPLIRRTVVFLFTAGSVYPWIWNPNFLI